MVETETVGLCKGLVIFPDCCARLAEQGTLNGSVQDSCCGKTHALSKELKVHVV